MTRGWAALTSVLAMLFTASMTAASSKQPVLVSVGPAISFEPGNIRITSRVEPAAVNRRLVIEVESDSHYTSSEVQLDGDQAPRSHFMYVKNLPAGEYQVVATLLTATGQSRAVRQAFRVMSARESWR
jgi:hypothetical protein